MRTSRLKFGTFLLFLADIATLAATTATGILIRKILPHVVSSYPEFSGVFNYAWWYFPVWIGLLAYEGAYTKRFTFWDEIRQLWKVSFFSTLAILSIIFIGKIETASRTVVVLVGVLSLALFPLMRISVKRLLIASGLLKRRAIILGANENGLRAMHALTREKNLGYEVVGFLDRNAEPGTRLEGVKVHGGLHAVERYVTRSNVHDIVLALDGIETEELTSLITRLQHKASSILYFPEHAGLAVIGTELHHFFHDQAFALEIKNNLARPFNRMVKITFDYAAGLILFIALAPILAVISILIRLTSDGPAILKQARIGRHGKLFKCYKFRSMRVDAEEKLRVLLETDAAAKSEWETYWKLQNDPRVTPLGRILRKYSLDELPQIVNVLKGEMSLIGPRPYLPRESEFLKNYDQLIHIVAPGITGLWQVSGRSDTSYQYRLTLDAWYVRNWNLWLDIIILLRTIKTIWKREGAR
jgi:Undecaprenyl-phosphate galactose phosphotransferase WbaP